MTDAIPAPRMRFRLDPSAERDNFAMWSEHVDGIARTTLIDEADRPRFAVHVDLSTFGLMQMSRTRVFVGQRQTRVAADIGRTGLTHIIMQLFLKGAQHGRYGARELDVREGDVCLIDLGQPFEFDCTPGVIIALMTSRDDFPATMRDRDLHGAVARAGNPATGLLTAHMRALDAAAAALTNEEGLVACRAMLLLAEAAFPPGRDSRAPPPDAEDQALYDRACAYIEEHLGDPGLALAGMTEALGVSRTSLYRLFENAGGAAAYIRERRLLRGYEIIKADLRPDLSLAEIGAGQGFGSEAYFNRAFKQRFGLSPGAARKAAQEARRRGEPYFPAPQTPGMAAHVYRMKTP